MNRKPALFMQRDMSILLDQKSQFAQEAKIAIKPFTELVKILGQYEVYECTQVSIWNGLALGLKPNKLMQIIQTYQKEKLPISCEAKLQLWIHRYQRLRMSFVNGELILRGDEQILSELLSLKIGLEWVDRIVDASTWIIKSEGRGFFKQQLAQEAYSVIDEAGYHDGQSLYIQLKQSTTAGKTFQLRDYQRKATAAFHHGKLGGSGVIVLPCGSGKTVTALAIMASLQSATLIVTSNVTSAKQWQAELLDKTTIRNDEVALYCGSERNVASVTVATYSILTHRNRHSQQLEHMQLFEKRDWGLIIYDEVQLLPAPIFRMTASIQATRRLGLTATLIREDGCAQDVYSLVGPKLFDLNWKVAEEQAYIAKVHCMEIRVPLAAKLQVEYEQASARSKLKMAAINEAKLITIQRLLNEHQGKQILIIGQYIDQLKKISKTFQLPLLTGSTAYEERDLIFKKFREGAISTIVVSKIANLAVDLPDAAVAIQVSGSFGSRQEEAQRIGRLLRTKAGSNEAWFYTVVTEQTKETEFSLKRGMFMLEQGYHYECVKEHEVF